MPGQVPQNPKLYRIVHWQNVLYILQHGMFTRGHSQADPNYVEIGHRKLIGQRHIHPIPDFPHLGNLGDCVPFYFGPHSPMLYMIWKGYQGVQQRPQDEIVYIMSSVNTIINNQLGFVFTDQHAKSTFANGYDNIANLSAIDWNIVFAKYWNDTASDMTKSVRKQAEFLVLNHVPPTCIEEIIVMTAARRTQIEAIVAGLNLNIPVTLNASLYF